MTKYMFENIRLNDESRYLVQMTNGKKLSEIHHSHDFYELLFVISGECEHSVENVSYTMHTGDFFILRPGETHYFLSQIQNTNLLGLSVEKNEFELMLSAFGENVLTMMLSCKNPGILSWNENVSDIYKHCTQCLYPSACEADRKLLLCSFIREYAKTISKTNLDAPHNLSVAMEKFKTLENLCCGIPALMMLSNYSHTQLSRLMHKYANQTLHDYVMNARLDNAYRRIIFTDEDLEEIAESVGYASFSHFCGIFKKKFNTTPSRLRKNGGIKTI